MATHSSILTWKTHGQRILAGYSPWGRKKLDMTERLHFHSLLKNQDAWFTLGILSVARRKSRLYQWALSEHWLGMGWRCLQPQGALLKTNPNSEIGSLWNDLPKYPGDSGDFPKKGVPGDLNLQ